MATIFWRGDAPAVAQIDSLTVGGTIEVGDIFNVTINGKTVTFTAAATTIASVVAGLVAALNASTIPEFAEVTYTDTSPAVTCTSDTAGKPFTITVTTTESGGGAADNQTFVRTNSVANSGPNDIAIAANWSGGATPTTEDVFIEGEVADLLYNLDTLAAQTLASLTIKQNFTGKIGLPKVNTDAGSGTQSYYEYRPTYLAVGATLVTIGSGPGSGSGRVKLNTGSVQTAVTVLNSGQPLENGVPAVLWKGTHASNTFEGNKGSIGIAFYEGAGETANVSGGFRCSYTTNQATDVDIVCGSGVTFATINKSGGKLQTASAVTTANLTPNSGDWTHLAGALTTLNGDGGSLYYHSSGTLATANTGSGCLLDFSRDPTPRAVTNLNVKSAGAKINDPNKTVTWGNPFAFPNGVGLEDVEFYFGKARTITVA